jgi:sugar/nucleoside kinase (ribokinase family)
MGSVRNILIVALCHPIVDRKITCDSDELHKKYGLAINGYKELSDGEREIRESLDTIEPYVRAVGGACMNTLRLLSEGGKHDLVYIGAVGSDEAGVFLEKTLKEEGTRIQSCLEKVDGDLTSECIVFIYGDERSLVSSLLASEKLSVGFVEDQLKSHETIGAIYTTAFLLSKIPGVADALLKANNVKFIYFNLAADSIYDLESSDVSGVEKIYEKIDCILGNTKEFQAFYKRMRGTYIDDINLIVTKLAEDGKVIICTDGDEPTIFCSGETVGTVEVEKIQKGEKVLDTCGAGDSFVAGFMNEHCAGEGDLRKSVEVGHEWARKYIRKNSGLSP